MNVWTRVKTEFIDDTAGPIFALVSRHPGAVFNTKTNRLKFWNQCYFSVVRSKGELKLYLNPKRGKRVIMPRESWLWDSVEEQIELLASTVAAEYDKRSYTAGFTAALQSFVGSRSGSELVFFRNGKTRVK